MMHTVLALLVVLLVCQASIKPGVPWYDTNGNLLDAHGAGLLQHDGKYYWYGSRRTLDALGTQDDGGIALYSSSDLYSWDFESVVVPVFNCTSPNSGSGVSSGDYPAPNCR